MARKKSNYSCMITMVGLVLSMAFIFVTIMMSAKPDKKEGFKNLKENFEAQREKNSCGTCRVRNQG